MSAGNTILIAALAATLAACGEKSSDTADEAKSGQDYAARMAREHKNDTPAASPAAQAPVPAPVKSEMVAYATVKGHEVRGYLAYPAQAEGGLPAVLLFHEWWGLNDNIKSMARQLAAQGYVALATDLYGGQLAAEPATARGLMDAALADPEAMGQNLRQAHAFLKEQIKATRIGTLGWCFGGAISLRTALLLPDQIDATVIYYGHVGNDPAELKPLTAPVLGLFGSADQGIPVKGVRQFEQTLKSLGKTAEIHIYQGAAHAFANPSGGNYKADASEDAWAKTLTFLAAHLKGG
jgi:carboxymethylenebutenolidase